MKNVKRLTAVILSALMMTSAFSVLPVSAAEVESNTSAVSSDENFISGDYEYTFLDDGTVEISKYIGSDKEITIPDTIDGKKVTSIGNYVFEHCIGLESITIPENITNIENMAFHICTNLESINVDVNNNIYSSIDGVLFNKEQDKIIFFPDNRFDSYEIPDSVTSIGNKAFYGCTNLTSITIPKSVTSIGDYTFTDCNNLTIYGYKNSYAEEYAKTNNIKFAVINSLADTNTNITVSGVMQEDAVLNVAKLENTFENSVATYDITLQKDGAVIQPDGTITVQIPSNAENCKVMWLKDDGTAEDMNAKYTDGCYVFTTDHLSVYALVQDKTILTGDANQDGIIDVNDVTYLQMHIAGKKTPTVLRLLTKQTSNCLTALI